MRSPSLAPALLMVALLVLLAISAGHNKASAFALQSDKPSQGQQSPQQPAVPADGVRRVTVDELRAALEKGTVVVVDVRSAEQYKAGHIKGAIWIPGNEIVGRVKELPKNKLIVTYCS
jgi:3-mercaptopyruvate sulfurtransferase SseA